MKRYQPRRKPFLARRIERRGRRRFILTLILTIFLVYSLFVWILPTLIGGLSILNRFKPTPQAQSPIAENTTLAPPVLNIPYEATSTATISVRGYATPNASVEIYIDDDPKGTIKTDENGSFTLQDVTLNLGSNNISGKTIDEKGAKSLSSKPIRIIFDNEKPKLELQEPSDNQTVKGGDKKTKVAGSTDPEEGVNVTVNDIRLIVNPEGQFSQTININEGENNITITATDTAGNTTQVTRRVIYEP